MSKSVLTLGGKRFVVLPESEYRSLKSKAAETTKRKKRIKDHPAKSAVDAGDVAEARRRLADPARVSATALFRQLGV